MPAEKVKLRIGSLARAVLVSGQAYQDPKDALNEFVSNAADEYVTAGTEHGLIRVVLRRRGRYPVVAVTDDGRGMTPDRLREVARSLFKSDKADDDRTVGEKAIGLLAFQQLGGRLDIISRAEDSAETWCLRLRRGTATAELDRERRRARDQPGTEIHIGELDPSVLRMLTQRKVVDYLRRRRAAALARGAYRIDVTEGRSVEQVTPEEPDGMLVPLPSSATLWGPIEFAIYVAPPDGARRQVAVVGRGGTAILDDLSEMEEFDEEPWTSRQVSGRIVCEALQQSAGRRAVLRDANVFPIFAAAVRSVAPKVAAAAERINRQIDSATADRMADEIRKVFRRVLKELADLDNPMRTTVGASEGIGALLDDGDIGQPLNGHDPTATPAEPVPGADGPERAPTVDELADAAGPPPPQAGLSPGAGARTAAPLPSVAPDPDPTEARSRFDPDLGVVLFNERHPDYLLVKGDESGLLDYLATLVAKEYVVYNNPLAAPDEIAEEMVRMLVRVRHHLTRRG